VQSDGGETPNARGGTFSGKLGHCLELSPKGIALKERRKKGGEEKGRRGAARDPGMVVRKATDEPLA